MRSLIHDAVNFLLPARCILTGDIVEFSEMISPDAWALLNFVSAPMCSSCGAPFDVFEEDQSEMLVCAPCLDYPPFYKMARAALIYDDESRGLLLAYKHGDKTHMALPFTQWMRNIGKDILEDTDLIVPVPLHWKRLVKRRYNQAALLAHSLSKKSNIPVNTLSLKRIKSTQSQGRMVFKERQKNIKGAFSIAEKEKHLFEGKSILLVDDVYTTGVTVNECARVLLDAGATSVYVLTVARTIYS